MDKCFCHLNGYAVKDATARQAIEDINTNFASKEELSNAVSEINTASEATNQRITDLSGRIDYLPVYDTAEKISYDNSVSGLVADTTQGAIDETLGIIEEVREIATQTSVTNSENVNYDNSVSGLQATTVKGAIDELKEATDNAMVSSNINYDNSVSNLHSTNVKSAIDELASKKYFSTLTATLTASETTVSIDSELITENSFVDIYTNVYGVNPTNIVVTNGNITITFEAQETNIDVAVRLS